MAHLEAWALSRTVIQEGMRWGGGRLGGRSGYTWPDLTLVEFLKSQLATQSSTQNTHRADFREIVVRTHIHSLTHPLTHSPTLYIELLRCLIERTPPPRGGFLFTMFPNQEPSGRGPPSKKLVQILRGGSSSAGFLTREHSK